MSIDRPPVSKSAIFAAAYLGAYVLLDWLSSLLPFEELHVAPWAPAPGVSLALLLLRGVRWAPLALAGALGAELLVRRLPGSPSVMVFAAVGETCVWASVAWLIRYPLKVSPALRSFHDVVGLIGGVLFGSLLTAAVYVGFCRSAGLVAQQEVAPLTFKHAVGDANGTLAVVTLLLVCWRFRDERPSLKGLVSKGTVGQAAATGGALWMLLFATWQDGTHSFSAMFVPMVWVAAERGLPGVSLFLAVVQAAVIGAGTAVGCHGLEVTKLQFLLLVMTVLGLLLGVVISERENARRAVADGERRLRAIVDLAPDAILVTDEHGRIEVSNHSFEELTGRSKEQVLGLPVSQFIAFPDATHSVEPVVRRADGAIVPIEIATAAVPIGDTHNTVVSARNITERKLAEERRNMRRSTMEEASRTLLTERLAASLAHELNQPLSALIGYAATCQRMAATVPDLPERLPQQLAKIVAQAERAGMIVGRLSEFFRGGRLEIAPVRLRGMVEEVVALLAEEAARCGIVVELASPGDFVVDADRLQIQQVLINLLRNGIQAQAESTEAGGRIGITWQASGDGFIRLSVADNGPGISPDVIATLFDPFVTTRPSGTGLGLAISRSIVESHRGRIWCEADLPAGAVFHFTLAEAPVGGEQSDLEQIPLRSEAVFATGPSGV